jgi:hypothetical protein
LVYARQVEPEGVVTPYAKTGQNGASDFAAAYAALQSAPWVENYDLEATLQRNDPDYFLRAICYRFDMQVAGGVGVSWEGETVLKFRVDALDADGHGQTWRIGFQQNDTGVPDDSWAWITSAPAATGVGSGLQSIDPNPVVNGVVLQRYAFFILSYDTWADPAASPTLYRLAINYLFFAF